MNKEKLTLNDQTIATLLLDKGRSVNRLIRLKIVLFQSKINFTEMWYMVIRLCDSWVKKKQVNEIKTSAQKGH